MLRLFAVGLMAALGFFPAAAQACLINLAATTYDGNPLDAFQSLQTQATLPGGVDPVDSAVANPSGIPVGPAVLNSAIGGSYAQETYQYSTTGNTTTFQWSVDLHEDDSFQAFAYQSYRIILKVEEDAPFSFTTTFPNPVLSQPGVDYRQQLLDNTDKQNPFLVFSDDTPTTETGVLLAGHEYILYGYEQASPGSLTSASGDFTFVVEAAACPTPEPASLTLAGLGAAGMALGALRRRRTSAK